MRIACGFERGGGGFALPLAGGLAAGIVALVMVGGMTPAATRIDAPQGLAASKALTTAAILDGFEELAARRAAESAALFASDDAREGMTAFLTKQRPSWDSSR